MIESATNWADHKGTTGKTEFRVADVQDLPFEDDQFDILICESVNVFIPDKVKAFSEYRRVIKPGAVIGISEAILTDAPPEIAADLLADYVGNEALHYVKIHPGERSNRSECSCNENRNLYFYESQRFNRCATACSSSSVIPK